MDALQAQMLSKGDIPAIATQVREQMDLLYAARFGRTSAKVLVWLFGSLGAGLVTWLTAHGYIRFDQ